MCHSNDMAFWKRESYGDNEEISGFQGFRGEKVEYAELIRFLGQ